MKRVKAVFRRWPSKSFWAGFDLAFTLEPGRRVRPEAAVLAKDLNKRLMKDPDERVRDAWAEVSKELNVALNEHRRSPAGPQSRLRQGK
jgi:hypothetical protein